MIHVIVVGLVVLFTPRIVHTHPRPREWANVVYSPPQPADHGRHFGGVRAVCQCVPPPSFVPPTITNIDVSPTSPSPNVGTAVVVGHAVVDEWDGPSDIGRSRGGQPSSGVLSADVEVQVTQYPGAPTPRYPETLREAGIQGEVTLEFVVDTTGRVEQGSVRVLSSTADAFVVSVRDALAGTRYHPALVGGQRVRQLVRQGFVFSLRQR
jgi:protein TonB